MPILRSVSGLRATLGSDLTPSLIAQHVAAASALLPDGPIAVGTDGRPSGKWIEDIVVGTLRACGRTVRILGMVPTPTVQLLVEHSDAAGGIVITASHNPAEWNGLKFVGPDGIFVSPELSLQIYEKAASRETGLQAQQQAGNVVRDTTAISEHLHRIRKLDVAQGLQLHTSDVVVVDAVNGSGSFIVPKLLQQLGYNVISINCDGSGNFTHPPEPIPENLTELGNSVLAYNAAFGVAVDPDADRLVLVGADGNPIGEEYTITLATLAALTHHRQVASNPAHVVVNYSTTRMVDDVASRFGATVHRSAVGEINVVRKMQNVKAIIGGEGSGGVIYPSCHSGRDAMVGLALIASHLRKHNVSLQEACRDIPRYAMVKTKKTVSADVHLKTVLDRCAAAFPEATSSWEDGLHLAWDNRWAHIRASNTEPVVRIIAEAPSAHEADQLIHHLMAQLAP